MQVFTNCVHGYDYERNVHASYVTCTRKSMHGINSSMLKLFEFANLCFFFFFLIFFALSLDDFIMYSHEGHKLWKLSTVHWCYQSVTIENYFSTTHTDYWFKKIRTTTTTAFLISNKVVPNPYIHCIAFDPWSFAQLS